VRDELELKKAATLGVEAEKFVQSNLGRALVERAQDVVDQAVAELKKINPKDTEGITRLQNEIWKAESFITWLDEIFEEGLTAEEALNPEYGSE